jgi:hypothetical protein
MLIYWSHGEQERDDDGLHKAVALVFDVLISLPERGEASSAIQLSVDPVDGYSVEIFCRMRLMPVKFAMVTHWCSKESTRPSPASRGADASTS